MILKMLHALIVRLIVYRVLHHRAHSVMDSISRMKMIKRNALPVKLVTARHVQEKVTKNKLIHGKRGENIYFYNS